MPVTVDMLKSLNTTANDPWGDFFIGDRKELDRLLDALADDSSLLGPMYLYMAAGTAYRHNRLFEAGLFFYQAQLRKAFEYERRDMATKPDGNNAATYLAFLNHTAGENINEAMRENPKIFKEVVQKMRGWKIVPAPNAYEPEFEESKGYRLSPSEWPSVAEKISANFFEEFAKPVMEKLDPPKHRRTQTEEKSDEHQLPTFAAYDDYNYKKMWSLLDKGADINATDKSGYTLLLTAAEILQFDIVYQLLQRGADFRIANRYSGVTVAEFIQDQIDIEHGDEWMEKCKQFLIEKGVKFRPPPKREK